ncbi:Lrp/AsnC family transcriptional regulator [Nocardia coffeae]|uniref:Lrp/AsnC family transcriptional regulator n=1 Tax=Nocardia coffeae TaxID=2873381 RepID=UPI001F36429C|nr:Lrp/AsnC family transcriptional regulator [Nocardia coffeae]
MPPQPPDRPVSRAFDETDIQLLDALHANPRASFERLGPALDISAVTAARRWQRLVESGRAWVSSVPGPQLALAGASLEIRAQPGRALEVARALAAVPQVMSVYATDGAFDLQALVITDTVTSLSRLLLEHLTGIPGIATAQSQVCLEWYSGTRWRLGAIDTTQQHSVTDSSGNRPPSVGKQPTFRNRTLTAEDRALFLALQHDGRARYRDLATQLEMTEQQVRRRLDTLVRHGVLGFRTDFTRSEGGWPTEYALRLSVPHHALAEVGTEIGRWPQTRICAATTGPANLLVMAQVHHTSDLTGLFDRIRSGTPVAEVVDHRLVLRAVKSWGRLLDENGHSDGVVPVDPWASWHRATAPQPDRRSSAPSHS